MKLLGSEELSHEVVQETFIRLWEKRSAIDPEKSLNAYLFTIAKNLIKDHQKAYAKRYQADYDLGLTLAVSHNDVSEKLDYEEIREIESQIVSKLPQQQQEVYRLSRYEQRSNQEIAVLMGISVNSVKTHLRLALKTLKVHLAPVSHLLVLLISMLPF